MKEGKKKKPKKVQQIAEPLHRVFKSAADARIAANPNIIVPANKVVKQPQAPDKPDDQS